MIANRVKHIMDAQPEAPAAPAVTRTRPLPPEWDDATKSWRDHAGPCHDSHPGLHLHAVQVRTDGVDAAALLGIDQIIVLAGSKPEAAAVASEFSVDTIMGSPLAELFNDGHGNARIPLHVSAFDIDNPSDADKVAARPGKPTPTEAIEAARADLVSRTADDGATATLRGRMLLLRTAQIFSPRNRTVPPVEAQATVAAYSTPTTRKATGSADMVPGPAADVAAKDPKRNISNN